MRSDRYLTEQTLEPLSHDLGHWQRRLADAIEALADNLAYHVRELEEAAKAVDEAVTPNDASEAGFAALKAYGTLQGVAGNHGKTMSEQVATFTHGQGRWMAEQAALAGEEVNEDCGD